MVLTVFLCILILVKPKFFSQPMSNRLKDSTVLTLYSGRFLELSWALPKNFSNFLMQNLFPLPLPGCESENLQAEHGIWKRAIEDFFPRISEQVSSAIVSRLLF